MATNQIQIQIQITSNPVKMVLILKEEENHKSSPKTEIIFGSNFPLFINNYHNQFDNLKHSSEIFHRNYFYQDFCSNKEK